MSIKQMDIGKLLVSFFCTSLILLGAYIILEYNYQSYFEIILIILLFSIHIYYKKIKYHKFVSLVYSIPFGIIFIIILSSIQCYFVKDFCTKYDDLGNGFDSLIYLSLISFPLIFLIINIILNIKLCDNKSNINKNQNDIK